MKNTNTPVNLYHYEGNEGMETLSKRPLLYSKLTVTQAVSVSMLSTRQNWMAYTGSLMALSSCGTSQMASSETKAAKAAKTAVHQSLAGRHTGICEFQNKPDIEQRGWSHLRNLAMTRSGCCCIAQRVCFCTWHFRRKSRLAVYFLARASQSAPTVMLLCMQLAPVPSSSAETLRCEPVLITAVQRTFFLEEKFAIGNLLGFCSSD